jgi:hypothetical protein
MVLRGTAPGAAEAGEFWTLQEASLAAPEVFWLKQAPKNEIPQIMPGLM